MKNRPDSLDMILSAVPVRPLAAILVVMVGLPILVAVARVERGPEKPRVLVVADSIGWRGWAEPLGDMVGSDYNIVRTPVNAEHSTKTLRSLDQWLEGGEPEVILWNNGLHDLRTDKKISGDHQIHVTIYAQRLREIVEKLKTTEARIHFLTTTPVEPWNERGRSPEDVEHYNAAALEVMDDAGVDVIDLNSYAEAIPHAEDGVHYTEDGYVKLASFVASAARLTEQF